MVRAGREVNHIAKLVWQHWECCVETYRLLVTGPSDHNSSLYMVALWAAFADLENCLMEPVREWVKDYDAEHQRQVRCLVFTIMMETEKVERSANGEFQDIRFRPNPLTLEGFIKVECDIQPDGTHIWDLRRLIGDQ